MAKVDWNDLDPLTAFRPWLSERQGDLRQAQAFLASGWASRSFPNFGSVPSSVLWTSAGTILLGQLCFILVSGVGRKPLLQSVEAVLASALLLLLLGLVFSLPLGKQLSAGYDAPYCIRQACECQGFDQPKTQLSLPC